MNLAPSSLRSRLETYFAVFIEDYIIEFYLIKSQKQKVHQATVRYYAMSSLSQPISLYACRKQLHESSVPSLASRPTAQKEY